VSAVTAWRYQRDGLADALGRLRRRHPKGYDRVLVDRAVASLDVLDALLEPTAAELVTAGWDVDVALEYVDRHRAALCARVGGGP
jgi:hypothetical protein